MKKNILSLALILASCGIAFGQGVGIGTTTPDASALLDLSTTNKGFLPPRMTAAQKALIPSPKAGLMIYQTDAAAGLYIYNGSGWVAAAGSGVALNGWSTTGNAGTVPATHFIGTTDDNPLKFRVNNIPSGELNSTTGNAAFGIYALASNTTGIENTAVGYNSLNGNLTGGDNTAFGAATLFSNTTGMRNVASGKSALVLNTTGNENVATGYYCLYNNAVGKTNVAIGSTALYSNTSGSSNIAIGKSALYYNTTTSNLVAVGDSALFYNGKNAAQSTHAIGNTAVGSKTLFYNTTGAANTAQGYLSLYSNTTGTENTAVGYNSLRSNEIGYDNTAVGVGVLYSNTNGTLNTASGASALGQNTSGSENVAMGYSALYTNLIGKDNVAIGFKALYSNRTGSNNSGLGAFTSIASDNLSNATAVGAQAEAACSNCLVLGAVKGENSALNSTRVGIGITAPLADLHIKQSSDAYLVNNGGLRLERATNTDHWDLLTDGASDIAMVYNGTPRGYFNHVTGVYTEVSDSRMKKDLLLIGEVLPRIMQLQPKTYHYIDNKSDELLSYGFVAQEVEKIFPDFVTTKGADDLKAVAYQNFTVVTVKAIQEQQQQLEVLRNDNELLKQRIEKLEAVVAAIIRDKK